MADTELIRCPVCLLSQKVSSAIAGNERLYCGNCHRSFLFRDALPLDSGVTIPGADNKSDAIPKVVEVVVPEGNPWLIWSVMIIVALVVMIIARPYMQSLKGPEFLGFYFKYFLGCLVALWLMRKYWDDSAHVTFTGLFLFESVGLLRLVDGYAAGMHKFTFLYLMMGIGAVLYFIRAEHFSSDRNSSGSSCSGFSSCSSCGSGCGGGCGGCGGCGG